MLERPDPQLQWDLSKTMSTAPYSALMKADLEIKVATVCAACRSQYYKGHLVFTGRVHKRRTSHLAPRTCGDNR
jgi:hypothetical protein